MKKILCICVIGGSLLESVFAEEAPASPEKTSDSKSSTSLDFVLQPETVLNVQVYQEHDLDQTVRVSGDCKITLLMIGIIDVKGKTLSQVESTVRELYALYLVKPQITILITEYPKRTVNVTGQVNSPGLISFPQEKGLTLMDAISRAGGVNLRGKKNVIKLTRTIDGKTETTTINPDDPIPGTNATQATMQLMPDDSIYVPEIVF